MKKFDEEYMIGRRFGRFVVIDKGPKHYKPSGQSCNTWLCKCECGNTKIVNGYCLRKGITKSCGCILKEGIRRTHGKSHTRLHNAWCHMRARCKDKNSKDYKDYGGRGITVCEEWDKSFESFYKWSMENGYTDELSIDRIDVNGNYEPSNCRWATNKEQARNTRKNRLLTFNGETKTMAEWSEITGLRPGTIQYRLDKIGWPVEKALTERSLRA